MEHNTMITPFELDAFLFAHLKLNWIFDYFYPCGDEVVDDIVITGGTVVSLLASYLTTTYFNADDIDIFIQKKHYNNILNFLTKKGYTYQNKSHHTHCKGEHYFDLCCLDNSHDIKDTLSNFDIENCCVGIGKDKIYYTRGAIDSIKEKKLKLRKFGVAFARSCYRIVKYMNRGYSFDSSVFLNVIKKIENFEEFKKQLKTDIINYPELEKSWLSFCNHPVVEKDITGLKENICQLTVPGEFCFLDI